MRQFHLHLLMATTTLLTIASCSESTAPSPESSSATATRSETKSSGDAFFGLSDPSPTPFPAGTITAVFSSTVSLSSTAALANPTDGTTVLSGAGATSVAGYLVADYSTLSDVVVLEPAVQRTGTCLANEVVVGWTNFTGNLISCKKLKSSVPLASTGTQSVTWGLSAKLDCAAGQVMTGSNYAAGKYSITCATVNPFGAVGSTLFAGPNVMSADPNELSSLYIYTLNTNKYMTCPCLSANSLPANANPNLAAVIFNFGSGAAPTDCTSGPYIRRVNYAGGYDAPNTAIAQVPLLLKPPYFVRACQLTKDNKMSKGLVSNVDFPQVAPTLQPAQVTQTSITWNWAKPSYNVLGYSLTYQYLSVNQTISLPASATSYTLSPVYPGLPVTMTLSAINAFDKISSNIATQTTSSAAPDLDPTIKTYVPKIIERSQYPEVIQGISGNTSLMSIPVSLIADRIPGGQLAANESLYINYSLGTTAPSSCLPFKAVVDSVESDSSISSAKIGLQAIMDESLAPKSTFSATVCHRVGTKISASVATMTIVPPADGSIFNGQQFALRGGYVPIAGSKGFPPLPHDVNAYTLADLQYQLNSLSGAGPGIKGVRYSLGLADSPPADCQQGFNDSAFDLSTFPAGIEYSVRACAYDILGQMSPGVLMPVMVGGSSMYNLGNIVGNSLLSTAKFYYTSAFSVGSDPKQALAGVASVSTQAGYVSTNIVSAPIPMVNGATTQRTGKCNANELLTGWTNFSSNTISCRALDVAVTLSAPTLQTIAWVLGAGTYCPANQFMVSSQYTPGSLTIGCVSVTANAAVAASAAPPIPIRFAAENRGPGGLGMSWVCGDGTTSGCSGKTTGYYLSYVPGTTPTPCTNGVLYPPAVYPSVVTYVGVDGLPGGQAVTLSVCAVDASGKVSPPSVITKTIDPTPVPTATPMPDLGAPITVSFQSDLPNQTILQWNNGGTSPNGYYVSYALGKGPANCLNGQFFNSSVLRATRSDWAPNQTVSVAICAQYAGGMSSPVTATVTTLAAAPMDPTWTAYFPTGLAAVSNSAKSLTVSWTDAQFVAGYYLSYAIGTNAAPCTQGSLYSSSTSTVSRSDLTSGQVITVGLCSIADHYLSPQYTATATIQ